MLCSTRRRSHACWLIGAVLLLVAPGVSQAQTRIAFIVGDPAGLGAGDQAVMDRLASLRFNSSNQLDPAGAAPVVTVFDDNLIDANDINDNFDLVISSATISSGNVSGKFRCLNIPHIYWEQALNRVNREGMTDDGGTKTADLGDIFVPPAALTHSSGIMAGLTPDADSFLVVFDPPQQTQSFGLGIVAAGVDILAETDIEGEFAVMVADAGGQRVDGNTFLGRRVFLPLENNGFEALNADGLAIFDRSVNWALAGTRLESAQDELAIRGESRLLPGNQDQLTVLIGAAGGFCQTDVTGEAGTTFSSSDPAVATVDESGRVTAVLGGMTTITANFGGFVATHELQVSTDRLTIVRSFAYGSDNNFEDVFGANGGLVCNSFNDPTVPMTYIAQGDDDNAETVARLTYNPVRGWGYIVTNPEHGSGTTKSFGPFDDSDNDRGDYNFDGCWEGLYDSFIGLKDFDNDDEQESCTFVTGAALGPCEDLCFRSVAESGGGHPNPGPDGIPGNADDELTCRGQSVLRLDVPRGLYRMVVAMGDADNVHAHGMVIEDSGQDDGEVGDLNNPHRWLIRDYDQSAYTIGQTEPAETGEGVYAQVGFVGDFADGPRLLIPPPGDGIAPDPQFVPMGRDGRPLATITPEGEIPILGAVPNSPILPVTGDHMLMHHTQGNNSSVGGAGGERDPNGSDMVILEVWRLPDPTEITLDPFDPVVGPGAGTVSVDLFLPLDCTADGPVDITITSDLPGSVSLVGATDGSLVVTVPQTVFAATFEVEIGESGTATLTATGACVVGPESSAEIIVVPLEAITVSVPVPTTEVGDAQVATAIGRFGPVELGFIRDVTELVTWTTEDVSGTGVLTNVDNVVTSASLGEGRLVATFDDVAGSINIAVVEVVTKIAFIGGSRVPDAADQAAIDRLKAMTFNGIGAQVIGFDDDDFDAAGLDGVFDLVIVASTVDSGNVGGQFRCLNVPMIYWEQALNRPDREGMTDDGDSGDPFPDIFIRNVSHPITAGFPGGALLDVFDSPQGTSIGLGELGAGVEVLAAFDETDALGTPLLMVAEAGGLRVDGTSVFLGRRVFLFLGNDTFDDLNADGLTIFDRSVNWALASARLVPVVTVLTLSAPTPIPLIAVGDAQFTVEGDAGGCTEDLTRDAGVSYSSSDESIATVNNDGVVTGVTAGTVTITATRGALQGSLTVDVDDTISGVVTISLRIAAASDDAEEHLDDGDMDVGSSDLELGNEGAPDPQAIGLRYRDIGLPPGSTVLLANVQFEVDNNNSGVTILRILGELSPDAAGFVDVAFNISTRERTTASVVWDVPDWTQADEDNNLQGPNQRTPDISAVLQEIIDQPGWAQGNSLVLFLYPDPCTALPVGCSRMGEREAESFNSSQGESPLLTFIATIPLSAAPGPELVEVMGGAGSAPDTFTSPLGETVPFDTVSLELTAASDLVGAAGMTLTQNGGGSHTLVLDTPVPVGTCVTLTFDVRDSATGGVSSITITLCHLPLDVNQDGVVNIADITAWANEFNGARRASLVDTNGDGNANVGDATRVGNVWFGRSPATKAWNGESL